MKRLSVLFSALIIGGVTETSEAVPLFARRYNVNCRHCHVMPPKLNQVGEDFVARGYRLDPDPPKPTFPISAWLSGRNERNHSRNTERAAATRLAEFIAAGPVGDRGGSYFIELLAVNNIPTGNGIRNRSGRFEDLFVNLPIADRLSVQLGQFRLLGQVDTSRRLAVSEPNALSAGLQGISLSGRRPALRFAYVERKHDKRFSDGVYVNLAVPFRGELALNDSIHNFSTRPDAVFMESYYKRGVNSIGGHMILDNDRRIFGLVGAYGDGRFFSTLSLNRADGIQNSNRLSLENEYVPVKWASVGIRRDHNTNQRPATVCYLNLQGPLTQHTFRLVLEHRQQRGNRATIVELSLVL